MEWSLIHYFAYGVIALGTISVEAWNMCSQKHSNSSELSVMSLLLFCCCCDDACRNGCRNKCCRVALATLVADRSMRATWPTHVRKILSMVCRRDSIVFCRSCSSKVGDGKDTGFDWRYVSINAITRAITRLCCASTFWSVSSSLLLLLLLTSSPWMCKK